VTNSTISGNDALWGVGIYGEANLINCTVSGKSAPFGGAFCSNGYTEVRNSIIANNGGNCYIWPISGSNNLVDDDTCGTGVTDPSAILLGPLGNYGGSTQTIPLLPGSAAIDAGDSAICTASPVSNLDQRGITRPADHCDIGAFESQGFTLSKTGGDNQSAGINNGFASPLQVTLNETGGAGLPCALVTFTAPLSGPSTNPANFTATTGANGVASATATANGTVGGPYNVTASVPDAAGVNFSLTNLPMLTLTIAFAGNGSGKVAHTSPTTPVISCIKGSSRGCSASYPLNTSVTLAATCNWKTLFGGWSGGVTGSATPVTFTMDSNKTVTATFNPDYSVRLLPVGSLFASIQEAYESVPTGSLTIQAQAHTFQEELLFDNNTKVNLSGGMGGDYNPTADYSTVKKLTVGKGQAVMSNIIIKSTARHSGDDGVGPCKIATITQAIKHINCRGQALLALIMPLQANIRLKCKYSKRKSDRF
jgi:hypothetical protein